MNKLKLIFPITAFFIVCLSSASHLWAQSPTKVRTEPNYEVVLQVVTASNSAIDKSSALPQILSNVIKKLKTNYSFSNYRLSSTYFQRIANTGNLEFAGVSNEPNQDVYAPIFSEWSFGQLTGSPDTEPQNFVSIQSFRFGQRVPLKTSSFKENDKSNSSINYEHIGLKMNKIDLPLNVPTFISTLSTSKSDELMFLVLTVKPAEE